MAKAIFSVDRTIFESKALAWAQQYDEICFLNSNGFKDDLSSIETILAVNKLDEFKSSNNTTFESLDKFKTKHPNKWMFGFFSYDLKDEIEDLKTTFINNLKFPECYFFVPSTILSFYDNKVEIDSSFPEDIYNSIINFEIKNQGDDFPKEIKIKNRLSKQEYYEAFDMMISHIKRGDIYEVNLCQEFYAENIKINPLLIYQKLNSLSPTPFSSFFKLDDKFIISASPERFLAKRQNLLISQPIKGTAPRGKTPVEDIEIKENLRNNPKEIAENVMIVDLVRNDLTRNAIPGTVSATKKLEVQSFKQVHQLVSTITCQLNNKTTDVQAIKNIFPPGSMTGAPKISAMKLCDQYENSKRGIYSGAVGYFNPTGDFDFNVIIRTILYNQTEKYLSFHTGGALTIDSEVDKEYNECLLKASAILQTLKK